jgi:hypothetical protein
VAGFVMHYQDEARHHAAHEAAAASEEAAVAEPDRWTGRLTWAFVGDRPEDPEHPAPASALQLGYHIDNLTAIMFVMVTFIATLIHVFSIGYMGDELAPVVEDHQVHTEEGHLHRRGRFPRFFLYLSLFCFSMLNLLLADNLFQVFVSWELVGVCSYLLIGYYFERHSAATAANKAFIVNRVGDAGFIIGLLILWTFVGTFNFQDLFQQLRAPIVDPTGKKIDKAAVIVRADPVPDQPGVLQVAEEGRGSEVLLQPVPAPSESVGLRPGNVVHTDPQWQREHAEAPKYRTMPYWLRVLAGLGIFADFDFGLAEEEVGTGVWTNEPAKAFDVSERYQATAPTWPPCRCAASGTNLRSSGTRRSAWRPSAAWPTTSWRRRRRGTRGRCSGWRGRSAPTVRAATPSPNPPDRVRPS